MNVSWGTIIFEGVTDVNDDLKRKIERRRLIDDYIERLAHQTIRAGIEDMARKREAEVVEAAKRHRDRCIAKLMDESEAELRFPGPFTVMVDHETRYRGLDIRLLAE